MLDSTYLKRKTLFWILNGKVAYSIWIKQEKVSIGALSDVKDLCDDEISDKNGKCNSRGKKFCFIFLTFFFFPSPSLSPSFPYEQIQINILNYTERNNHLYVWLGKSYVWKFPLFCLKVNEALNALQGSVSKPKPSPVIKQGSFRKLEHRMSGLVT